MNGIPMELGAPFLVVTGRAGLYFCVMPTAEHRRLTEDQERLAAKAEPGLNITPADRFDGDKMEALTELLGGAA